MQYFAVQVRSSSEQSFIQNASAKIEQCPVKPRFILLKRSMTIKRKGKTIKEERPLFPGYVFLENNTTLGNDVIGNIRSSKGFYRFLKSNNDITPLSGSSLETMSHFLNIGETAEFSKVYFDENDKIVVTEGPLKGLEGCIIKIDKRKHRAKIKVDFDDNKMIFDLSFDIIEKGNLK